MPFLSEPMAVSQRESSPTAPSFGLGREIGLDVLEAEGAPDVEAEAQDLDDLVLDLLRACR